MWDSETARARRRGGRRSAAGARAREGSMRQGARVLEGTPAGRRGSEEHGRVGLPFLLGQPIEDTSYRTTDS
jgi:hypothetical protein